MNHTFVCPVCGRSHTGDAPSTAVACECCSQGTLSTVESLATAADVQAGNDATSTDDATGSGLLRKLLYGVSLPERLVRGAVGLSAGATRELAGLLVPKAFQDSASYRIAIDNSLGFLTHTVGGVPRATDGTASADDAGDQLARKAVGNFVDLAGLATLHVSPMWLLAVVSDAAYGSKTYLRELAAELAAQGLIDDSSTIHNVDDVLNNLQKTCGTAAGSFDQPPLSVAELRRSVDEVRQSLADTNVRGLLPEAELRRYWDDMKSVATSEKVSLLGVSGALAMRTMQTMKEAGQGTWIGLRVAGGLLNRNIFGHYRDSLARVVDRGLFATVQESYGPYVDAVWSNFSSERKSWTETLLDPATVVGWLQKAGGLLKRTSGGGPVDEVPKQQ
jgi:hypothetical protein